MQDDRPTPRVVVIGAGASGSLTALHLARAARRRGTGLDVVLVDPAVHRARGTAFGTTDPQHLLNVAAGGMSALPEDPGHFVAWRARQHPELMTEPGVFAPRVDWGRYLDETVAQTFAGGDQVGLRHLRVRATGIRRDDSGVVVTTDDGHVVVGDAVVLATGEKPPGFAWAPEALQRSAFFVPDPWAPGAVDVVRRDAAGPADVLLIGTGLTMVDVVLSLTGPSQRPDRHLHAVSRHGELPKRHVGRAPARRHPGDRRLGRQPGGLPHPRGRAHRRRPARDRRLASGGRRAADRGAGAVAAARRVRPRGVPARRRQHLGTPAPSDASRLGRRDHRARELRDPDPQLRRGCRRRAAHRRRPAGDTHRRQRPRRRVGGELHRHQHRRAPGRRPAGGRPADPAGRGLARSPEHCRARAPDEGRAARRLGRIHRGADLDARARCGAASCTSRPPSRRSAPRRRRSRPR